MSSPGIRLYLPTPPDGVAALPLWLKGVDQGLLHPTPTAGFRGRLITLLTLSTFCTVLAAVYGITGIVRSQERPRTKALWFSRFVSRSSGRFIVINPRIAWSLGGVIVGLWSLALIWYNWRAFLQDGDQASMWGVRAYQHFVWFVVGWPVSWAGAQAYLLTADAPKSKLPNARTANLLFLIGGAFLAACSFSFAMFQSVRGREYWFAGGALRQALVDMLNTSPTGSPNQEQMEILIPLADKTAQTWNDLKVATIIHASFSPIPVLACLVVNGLGVALVYKLHRQVRESASLATMSSPGRFTSDDPADWHGPSATSAPMSDLEGSTEKLASLAPPISPPMVQPPSRVTQGDRQTSTLWNLKRAELDMGALTIYFIISTCAYTVGFILADIVMSVDSRNTWNFAEGAFGVPLWSTVIISPILYSFLIFNTASDRLVSSPSQSLSATVATLPTLATHRETTTSKLTNLVPVLRRNNSRTPMMLERPDDHERPLSTEIRVTVQIRTDEYDVDKEFR